MFVPSVPKSVGTLARQIRRRGIGDGVAESPGPIEVQDDRAEPGLTEYENPWVPVFLGHLPSRADDAHQLAEPTRVEQRHRLPAQREDVNHQTVGSFIFGMP